MSRAPRCLTTAMSHGDSRTTSSIVGEITGRVRVPVGARLAAPAEDHQVGFLLGGRLDDARGRVAADPHQRVDHGALGRVVEDLLQQPARLPGARRALGQRHALGHLDDAERGQLAGPRLHQRGADPDRAPPRSAGSRPGSGSGTAAVAGVHAPASAARARPSSPRRPLGPPAVDEVRLEQLELARLALDPLLGVGRRQVPGLDDEAADPPEVDRHERGDHLAGVDLAPPGRRAPGRRSGAPTGRRGSGTRPAPRPSRASRPAPCRPRRPARACGWRPRRACPPPRRASGRRRGWRHRSSGATCRRRSASPRGTRTAGGSRSPRAAAGR